MSTASELESVFSALFGDGSPLYKEDGRWTFRDVPGLPKLPNEGLLTYLNRLAENCLVIRGVWVAGSYKKNQAVAHENQMWVAVGETTSTPGTDSTWVPMFYSLTGLKGDPGRDGFNTIAEAPL